MTEDKRFVLNKGISNFSDTNTEKVYSEYNLEEIVDLLNELNDENKELQQKNKGWIRFIIDEIVEIEMLKQQIKEKNNYQRLLESKIIRLKDRVKTFEKNYSLKDIERYKQMDNPNMITHKRLWGVKRHE